jgi:hypothetical protein
LQEAGFLLRIPATDDLPEILDDFILFLVSAVVGVLLPVFDIDIGNASNEKLEFTFVEDVYQVGRDEFVETSDKRIELLLNTLLDLPFCD